MKPSEDRFDDLAEGDSAELAHTITTADVDHFVELSGDRNPVHLDSLYAARAGLGTPVVHGMLTAAFVSTVLGTMLPGEGTLWLSQRLDFLVPVRVGDTVRIRATITRASPGTRVVVLRTEGRNQRDQLVMDGEARVRVLRLAAGA
jgi:3-oxoacyl-[acyl-carrier protein] reductase